MPRKPPAESPLFVRLPATAAEKLDRAAEALGVRKKDLVANLVSTYVDPDSHQGLTALGALSTRKLTVDRGEPAQTVGSYSFHPYDPPEVPPEVLNVEQAAQFLQIEEDTVIEMAESGKLPGRKLGKDWRFARAALVAWLSGPERKR